MVLLTILTGAEKYCIEKRVSFATKKKSVCPVFNLIILIASHLSILPFLENPSLVDELETAKILQQLRESKKRSHTSNRLVEPLGKQVVSRKRRLSSNPSFLERKRLPEANRTDNRRAASDVPLSMVLGNISSLNARPVGPPPQLRILHYLKHISSTIPVETSSFIQPGLHLSQIGLPLVYE